VTDSGYGALSNAWSGERRRLASAEEILDPSTFRHLDTIGIATGMRCLEVGGGGGSVARFMADRVGPGGFVLVTDIDTRLLDGCDAPNIEVRTHNIRTDPLDGDFDVIHARLVLEHLPERLPVLAKLVALLRPGGWVLIEDGDCSGGRHLPAARQFVFPERLRTNMRHVFRALDALGAATGMNPEFGRELPRHLVEAGLEDVDAEVCARLVRGATSRAFFYTDTWREVGSAFAATGHVSEVDLDQLLTAFESPTGMIMSFPMVSAWGRRP
jgi:SAM-dependent methyltransferase